MRTPEARIQAEVRLALGALPDLVMWRNSTGVAQTPDGRSTRFGLCVGSSDLVGLLAPTGRFVAIEVKAADGRPTDDQLRFLRLVRSTGGFACIVRSAEEALLAVERARKGESE